MRYKNRHIEFRIDSYLKIFPVVSVTGPRQAGKSTLLKYYIGSDWKYYTLDDQSLLMRIKDDPDFFMESLTGNTVIDEAQKVPELFHSVKRFVDENNDFKIMISGSANFLLMESITESLAGRVGLLELFPYSLSEVNEIEPNNFIDILINASDLEDLEKRINKVNSQISWSQLMDFILFGGYPRLYNLDLDNDR